MKNRLIQNCRFLYSAVETTLPPPRDLEIVLVGRSNVGKSSLINHLFNNKNLAKTSKRPGKTECLNYFDINESCYLVDTPGYGFARRSGDTRARWNRMMQAYLSERNYCIKVVHLLDSRHPPSHEDQDFFDWIVHMDLQPIFVFTKIDKCQRIETEREKAQFIEAYQKHIHVPLSLYSHPTIFYSIKGTTGKKQLKDTLQWEILEKTPLSASTVNPQA